VCGIGCLDELVNDRVNGWNVYVNRVDCNGCGCIVVGCLCDGVKRNILMIDDEGIEND
jgi:hypothetical protein